MKKVIGVRFRTAGKIYFFDPGKLSVKRNDHVIVETAIISVLFIVCFIFLCVIQIYEI